MAELRIERDVLKRSVVLWVKEATRRAWHDSSPTRGRTTACRTPLPACLLLGVSVSRFYRWRDREPTVGQRRRAAVDAEVRAGFEGSRGLHGSPRVHADLREAGWTVSEKTVATR